MAISVSLLRDHGIQLQQGEIERLFCDAVRRFSLRTRSDEDALSEAELAALARGGLGEVEDFTAREAVDPIGQGAAEYAAFEDLSDWVPYGEAGDEVRGGTLRLTDSRTPDELIDVRVVGHRRHRTGNVAW